MDAQTMVRQFRIEQWKKQIDECIASGKPVRSWCEENALSPKTYYYRLKRVREFACQALEVAGHQAHVKKGGEAIFAEVQPYAAAALAITVRIQGAEVEIHNGAGAEVIENTIRALRNIC